MTKRTTLILMLMLSVITSKAQSITPTQLLQLYGYFTMDGKRFAYNTNDYFNIIDKNWIGEAPTTDVQGDSYLWSYYKDRKTFQEPFMVIGGVFAPNTPNETRVISYHFTGKKLYDQYLKQMKEMKAEKIRQQASGGGMITWYVINEYMIGITEYPPGILTTEKAYDVQIRRGVEQ